MRIAYFLTILLISICTKGIAESACMSLAKTELERIYCQVAASPEVINMPSFADFRRNNWQVQKMLLKRPAARLGIALPADEKGPAKQKRSPQESNSTEAKTVVRTKSSTSTHQATPPSVQSSMNPQLDDCQLIAEEIRCPNVLYRLTHNRQNHQLLEGVLADSNKMNLPAFQGDLNDKVAVNRYLANCYQEYIDKMLLIGLGGSTMTYTKFHHSFWELMGKGEDFADRVGKMYTYLKNDKRSMAIKKRYDRQFPQGIDWCTDLNDDIVVCDNARQNWVYERYH